MAKQPRVYLERFGKDGPTDDFAIFGSQREGSPVKTKDIGNIQTLDAWLNGIKDAIVAANRAPYLEDFNSLFLVLFYQLFYNFQEGIPEWQNQTTYYIGGIVKKVGTAELYKSLINDNLGNVLPDQVDDSNWAYLSINLSAGEALERTLDVLDVKYDDASIGLNGGNELEIKDDGIVNSMLSTAVKNKIVNLTARPSIVVQLNGSGVYSNLINHVGPGRLKGLQLIWQTPSSSGTVTVRIVVDGVTYAFSRASTQANPYHVIENATTALGFSTVIGQVALNNMNVFFTTSLTVDMKSDNLIFGQCNLHGNWEYGTVI